MEYASKIEQELAETAAITPKRNEDRQKYLKRLMLAVSKLPDPDWESLSTEAQDWNNGAAEAHKAGDEIEDFPDLEEEDEELEQGGDDEVDEEEEQVEVPAKETAPKEERTPKFRPATNSSPGKKVSACHVIKRMVARKPAITVAELIEKLKEENFKVSDVTVATLRSDFRDSLRVLNELEMGNFKLT